ncbi:sigma factor [Pedobacter metabolipauper]|uniref:DNA-directed RNA polymerase specialized sigma24 family protein n=1 Tax=Pedobacter metabolipauper TaxID=425513 RepID=A0A4R6SW91_9SPHI|nr:sigma factor [Pedobacter metabolipauper]TDQ08392.1 DNA-directed RNA polymerase specialized sigma24 family protein [Pedobacter metabolipauper]
MIKDVKSIPAKVNEQEVLTLLRAGNYASFAVFYEAYAPLLMGVILRTVKTGPIAERVLEETLVMIWASIDQYNESKERLFTWMVKIAKQTAAPHRVNGQAEVTIGLKDLAETDILELIVLKGYTIAEVAFILDTDPDTISCRLRAAVQSFRKM